MALKVVNTFYFKIITQKICERKWDEISTIDSKK